jgi:cell volume regulation protein A
VDGLPHVQAIKRRMADLLGPRPGQHLLEAGCGLGHELRRLAGRVAPGGTVLGIDMNQAMIDEARRRTADLGGAVRCQIGDVQRLLGDQPAPFKREIERFHGALASLAEIVAFTVLGLTINLSVLARADVWVPGVIAGAAVAFVIRPLLVGLCLGPARLSGRERAFVLFAGLKGAVPILLGSFLLAAHIPDAERYYEMIVIVVIFSVFVPGSLVPAAARLLRIQMRTVEPQPWALGVRLQDEPSGVHRLTIKAGSPADGRTIGDLARLPGDAWVSFVVRDGQLVAIRKDTVLRPGDDVLVLADPGLGKQLSTAFEGLSGETAGG